MITVVKMANRSSGMESFRGGVAGGGAEGVSKGTVRAGELLRELDWRIGRHLSTASIEARQGWTWSG
jgi:hypothetical protein